MEVRLTAFWEGMLAGYGVAMPVGAIGILIVALSIRRGFCSGFMAGAATATVDFLYATLATFAGDALVSVFSPLAIPLRIASSLVLVGLGCRGLRHACQPGRGQIATRTDDIADSLPRTYVQFLSLTLLNPLTMVYFGAMILGAGKPPSRIAAVDRAAFVAGAGLASLSWQSLLATIGAVGGRVLSPRLRALISIAGNLVVVGLGLRVLVQTLS